jgi:hypothetical protein
MEKNELKLAVASLMKDQNQRFALAEMITEFVEPTHIMTDFVSMLLDARSLNPGDSLVKRIRKGIKVHSFVPGTKPLRSEITIADRMNFALDTWHVGVTANTLDLARGDIGTVDEIKNETQKVLRDYLYAKVFTALTTVWTTANTPSNFTDVGGDVTKTALDAMIEVILQRAPSVKAIAGVRSALQPITEFAGWANLSTSAYRMADSVSEELARTGWVGQYKGIPLVVIPEDRDIVTDVAKVPTNKVLVIGDSCGEYITYGPANPVEYEDKEIIPPQWNYSLWGQHAFMIDKAARLGILETD